jgi:hypothetical protein
MLFRDANARVLVNGCLSPSFPLQKSIPQGCPLAPFLYVHVVDALGYLFQHAHLNKVIQGIPLPGNATTLKSHIFYDNMFIQNSEEELTNTLDILDMFCTISGSKLTMHKIEFIMIFPTLLYPLVGRNKSTK